MKYTILAIIIIGLLSSGCSLLEPLRQNNISENTPPTNEVTNNESITNEEPIQATAKNSLNLSNQQLSKIPEYVFSQNNLEDLNVSNNQLTGAIQAEIRQLQNLRVLNASNNQMTGVPAEIGQLQNLEILNLSNNQLTGLPYELGNLKNLKTLNISGNNYSEPDLSIITEKLPVGVNIIK